MIRTSQLNNQKGLVYVEHDSSNPDVQYIWELSVLKSKKESVEYKIIPDGCIDIIFESQDNSLFNPVVSAPFLSITKIHLPTKSKYVGIRFKPGKLRKYIDIDPSKIDTHFDDFQTKEYKSIKSFIASLGNRQTNPLTRFNNNLQDLLHSSLSQRQKRRVFKSATGFNIREFKKIMKFQASLTTIGDGIYFDQSHMIKAFKSLVGMTPSQLDKYL